MKHRVVMVIVLALALSACGGSRQIGQGVHPTGSSSLGGVLGGYTPTPSPSHVKTGTPRTRPSPSPSQTHHISLTIKIIAASPGIDPQVAAVGTGGRVRVTNKDTKPRSLHITGAGWSYDSGTLAPGASVEFVATRPGEYQMEDGTRPYVVGNFRVSG